MKIQHLWQQGNDNGDNAEDDCDDDYDDGDDHDDDHDYNVSVWHVHQMIGWVRERRRHHSGVLPSPSIACAPLPAVITIIFTFIKSIFVLL